MARTERDTLTLLLTLGAVGLILSKLDDLFGDGPPPGGDAPPAPEDPRPATITQSQANAMADAFETAIWGSGVFVTPWERDWAAAGVLMLCNVDADVRLLVNTYGERGTLLAPQSLASTVSEYLDADVIEAVNLDYQRKGIQWRW